MVATPSFAQINISPGISISGTPTSGQIALWSDAATLLGDGLLVGDTTDGSLTIRKNQNGATRLDILNGTDDTFAEALLSLGGGSTTLTIEALSVLFSDAPGLESPGDVIFIPSADLVFAPGVGRTKFGAGDGAGGTLELSIGITGGSITAGASATLDEINIPARTATVIGTTHVTTAKGFNKVSIYQPTYTDSSSVTIDRGATLYIEDAPAAAGSVTLTSGYALWVDNGLTRLDGHLIVEGVTSTGATGTGKLVFDTAPQISTIELGNASDTTLSRSSAGVVAIEGTTVSLNSTSSTHTASTIELGNASDTTLSRSGAGVLAVEGVNVLLNGGALGTPASGTLTNCTALPVAGITASTSTALGVGSVELGAASDTTIARSGAGAVTVEGVQVILSGAALGTPSGGTLTNCTGLPVAGITASTSTALGVGSIELGAASDTTIARSGAGAITVEGVQVILSGAALGTPASGVGTNLTGTADGLTAGDVTRNHAVYAGASPPTVDVGIFTISKASIDMKTAATTTVFTVPASRTFVCTAAWFVVTAVTGGAGGTETFKIQESGASGAMTTNTASGSATPVVGIVYAEPPTAAGAPWRTCAAGNSVQVVVATSQAGSTTVTGTIFVQGFYSG